MNVPQGAKRLDKKSKVLSDEDNSKEIDVENV
jgi:hypothetical protein